MKVWSQDLSPQKATALLEDKGVRKSELSTQEGPPKLAITLWSAYPLMCN